MQKGFEFEFWVDEVGNKKQNKKPLKNVWWASINHSIVWLFSKHTYTSNRQHTTIVKDRLVSSLNSQQVRNVAGEKKQNRNVTCNQHIFFINQIVLRALLSTKIFSNEVHVCTVSQGKFCWSPIDPCISCISCHLPPLA